MTENVNDDEYEESLILVELSGIIDQDWQSLVGDRCKILGIETEQPILQLGRYVFMGQYEDLVGTGMMFHIDKKTEESEEKSDGYSLKYFCHTHKKLDMRRAFLAEKEDATDEIPTHTNVNDDDKSSNDLSKHMERVSIDQDDSALTEKNSTAQNISSCQTMSDCEHRESNISPQPVAAEKETETITETANAESMETDNG